MPRDENDRCICNCHRDGSGIMHIRACCDFCYQKFINTNGTVDETRYAALVAERDAKRAKEARRTPTWKYRK